MPFIPPFTITLGFRGLQLEVQSNLAAPLDWLKEFLFPWFDDRAPATAHRTIQLHIDEPRYQDLLAQRTGRTFGQIDCFTLDGEFARHDLWVDGPRGRLVHDATAEMVIAIDPAGTHVQLTARTDHARLRVGLMRVARELASIHALHSGDLFLHAAAGVSDGKAIAIAGQKRAGKTSNLINALRHPHTHFLTNDRLFLTPGTTLPTAHGMPTIIKVRPDSLPFLPDLSPPDFGFPYRQYLTIQECRQGSPLMEPPKIDPPGMNAVQFCRWLKVDALPSAPLAAMVFPTLDPSIADFQVQPLDRAQGLERMHASLFSAGPTGPVPRAFSAGWHGTLPTPDSIHAACETIASQCRFLGCRIGPQAFHQPNVWEHVMAAML